MKTKLFAFLAATIALFSLSACSSNETTMTLTQQSGNAVLQPLEVNPDGDVGDVTVFEAPVFKDDEEVGMMLGTMTKVSAINEGIRPDREERLLNAVFDLNEGSISVMGISYYVPDATKLEAGKPVIRAIVGGTGAYKGATGQVTTTLNSDKTYTHILEFHQ